MIVYSIVITALLMSAVVCLMYEHLGRIREQERAESAEKSLFNAMQDITGYRIEKANRDGLDAGRASDTMYREFLRQFDAHEQVTVMFRRDDAKYYEPKH